MEQLILSLALTLVQHYASGAVANSAVKSVLLAIRDAVNVLYPST